MSEGPEKTMALEGKSCQVCSGGCWPLWLVTLLGTGFRAIFPTGGNECIDIVQFRSSGLRESSQTAVVWPWGNQADQLWANK